MSSAAPAAPAGPLPANALIIFTIAVSLATFMEVLDTSIANVAIPTIAGNLAVSANQGTWVISSYGLAAAIVVPLTGWIAKRLGEVRTFIWSVFLFTIASGLCGFATSLPMLVAFRFLQGLVSGPMVPLSQALLLANFPPQKRGIAMAIWAMTVVVAPICGPLLGGYITDNLSWPWIFYINAPIGLISAFVTFTLLRKRESPIEKKPIDIVGLVLLVLGVGSLQLMLDNGNDLDWFNSTVIVCLCITTVVALTFLIAWELTDEHPIVDLTLFSKPNFRYGVIAMAVGYMSFFAMTVLFPLWLQTVMGYTPTWAGIATSPVGIFALILSPIIGRNIQRLDLRVLASIAYVVFAITAYWFSTFTLDTSLSQVYLPRLLQGVAVACFFVPINQIIMSGIQPGKLAAASGLSSFFRTLSGSLGTAIVVTLWDHRTQVHSVRFAENLTTNGVASLDYINRLQHLGLSSQKAYAQVQNVIQAQSAMLATSEVFWGISILFLMLIGLIWLTRPPFGAAGAGGGH
jgi:DHA2 family multidrug resistance protein